MDTRSWLLINLMIIVLFKVDRLAGQCQKPRSPLNGSIRREGPFVVYDCNDGYKLVGPKRQNCIARNWVPNSTIRCEKVEVEKEENEPVAQKCTKPPEILNGQIIPMKPDKLYDIGDEITVLCDNWYRAVNGSEYLQCTEELKWDQAFPVCVAWCGKLAEYDNGHWSYESEAKDDEVKAFFICNRGFQLVNGLDGKLCINGNRGQEWIGEDPQCEKIDENGMNFLEEKHICPQPPKINNGRVVPNKAGEDYYAGEEVMVECDALFELVGGSSVLHCTNAGTWNYEFAKCEHIKCAVPIEPENGSIRELLNGPRDMFNYGDIINYECLPGFKLQDSPRRMCTEFGWNHHDPICTRLECKDFPELVYSRTQDFDRTKEWLPGDELELECLYGYRRKDKKNALHLYCDENGNWDTKFANCEAISCEEPAAIANGIFERTTEYRGKHVYLLGEGIQYKCLNNLLLVGAADLQCTDNGWSHDLPTCKDISCEKPDMSDNIDYQTYPLGKQNQEKFAYGDEIRYRCNGQALALRGSSSQKCTEKGWTGQTPFCQLTGCDIPVPPENGYFRTGYRKVYNYYSFRSTVELQCNFGYKIESSEYRQDFSESTLYCKQDGTWSKSPRCIEVTCPLPPPVQNGRLENLLPDDKQEYPVDYNITYKCDAGYTFYYNSATSRVCRSNGKWSSSQPYCREVTCSKPSDYPNAVLQTDIYGDTRSTHGRTQKTMKKIKPGFQVTYSCSEGYSLAIKPGEEPKSTCQENGQWSERSFQCLEKKCLRPQNIENGFISPYNYLPAYPVGSEAVVQCEQNFKPSRDLVICQPNGLWNLEHVFCEPINVAGCGHVPVIEHGSVMPYWNDAYYPIGTVARITCNDGQETTMKCLQNGVWSLPSMQCPRKTLSCEPPVLANGYVRLPAGMDTYPPGISGHVICDRGFHSNEYVVTCEENGTWKMDGVQCHKQMQHCAAPPLIVSNGVIVGEPPGREFYSIGQVITYGCKDNFTIKGDKTNFCTANGWHFKPAPKCVAKFCDPTPVLKHGFVTPLNQGYLVPLRSQVKIVCQSGYTSKSDVYLCDEKGNWNIGDCERDVSMDCVKPQPIENGIIEELNAEETMFSLDSKITYKCDENYALEGESERYCGDGGWTGEAPSCKVMFCTAPRSKIQTRSSNNRRFDVGSVFKRKCQAGYAVLDATDSIECLEGGQWNATLPECKRFRRTKCPMDPFSDEHGMFEPIDETLIKLVCSDGKIPLHSNFTKGTCDERFGKWIISQYMTCVPKREITTCEPQPNSFNGSVSGLQRGTSYENGDELILTCDEGFTLANGTDSVTCLENGYWDGILGSCEVAKCDLPKDIPSGKLETTVEGVEVPYGTVVNFRCNRGYQLSGRSLLQCSENGWNNPIPSCKKIRCSDPGTPENGWYHVPSFKVGERITFGCFSGYKLYGSKERICLENGKWSGPLTICDSEEQDCPEPGTPHNGIKTGNSYNLGDVVMYSCQNGYTLLGSRKRICQNRSWTGGEPQCIGMLDYEDANDVSQSLRRITTQLNNANSSNPSKEDGNRNKELGAIRSKGDTNNLRVVCYIFDSSNSIGSSNFKKSVELAKVIIKKLSKSSGETCVIVFSSEATLKLAPNQISRTEDIIKALDDLQYKGGSTSLFSAFKVLQDDVMNQTISRGHSQENTTFVTFLFTDGKVKNDHSLRKMVKNIKREYKHNVYCIALTGFPNKDTLFSITNSYGKSKKIFLLDSYSTLDRITSDLKDVPEIDYSTCGKGYDGVAVHSDENSDNPDHAALQLWPWTVQILKVQNRKALIPLCLGSLIADQWVLTSGLCVPEITNPRSIFLRIGVEKFDLRFASQIKILGIQNPARNVLDATVSLIKLNASVTFSQYVRPVCLPDLDRGFKASNMGYTNSWSKSIESGRYHTIDRMHLPIVSEYECEKGLNKEVLGPIKPGKSILCAGDTANSLDVCGPDLGSPLFQYNFDKNNQPLWVLIGVASAMEKNGEKEYECFKASKYFDIYANVSSVTRRIREIIDT